MEKEDRKKIADAVSSMIDKWVSELVILLKSGEGSLPKRSLWDRFKGGISNVFYGRDNEDNPYYWMNRFGDELGSKGSWRGTVKSENFNPGIFTLSEYGFLKNSIEHLEDEVESLMVLDESVSFEDLRIFQMIKGSAEKLKSQLRSFIMGDSPASSVSDVAPGEVAEPPRKINEPKGSRSSPPPNRSAGSGSSGTESPSSPPSGSSSSPKPASTESPSSPPSGSSSSPKPASTESPSSPPRGSSSSPKPANREDSSNSAEEGSSSSKFAESLREAIKAVKERKHDSLKPNNYWLTKTGKLSSLVIPKAIAWLAMKSHIDMSDDEQVENALRQEIGDEFKGLLAKSHDGNSLLKNFLQKVPKSLVSKALLDLGVDESLLNKEDSIQDDEEKEKDSSSEKTDLNSEKTDSSSEKTDLNSEKTDSSSEEENEINKSLIVIKRIDDIEQMMKSLTEKIVKPILKSADASNKQGIKDWWINFKQQNREIDSLRIYLMDGDESQFMNELMRISELSEEEILKAIS